MTQTHTRNFVRTGAAGTGGDNPFGAIPNWYWWLSAAGTVAGVYHGWKRDNSVGWAVVWGLAGGAFPWFTLPLSLAQGFGKPK